MNIRTLRKHAFLLIALLALGLQSCNSNTEPDSNNNNNNSGNNNGSVKVGSTFTFILSQFDKDGNKIGSDQEGTSTLKQTDATYKGRSNVMVVQESTTGAQGYAVLESNGDMSQWMPMAATQYGTVGERWIRMPIAGGSPISETFDTIISLAPSVDMSISATMTNSFLGEENVTVAGETFATKKLKTVQKYDWTFGGMTTTTDIVTTHYYSPKILQVVKSETTTTQSAGGTSQVSVTTRTLKSYNLK